MDPEDCDIANHEQASISAREHRGLLARIAELEKENAELRPFKAWWLALFGEGQREKWTEIGKFFYPYNENGCWNIDTRRPTPEALADELNEGGEG